VTPSRERLVDSHAHLDDEQFESDVDEVIERARAAGIGRIINVGYRSERWPTTIGLAARHPIVAFTLGLHPHHADEWNESVENDLLTLLRKRRPVAVGEIGLDYVRNSVPPDRQAKVFRRQLEIADQASLPVVIHQRGAETDLIEILAAVPASLACILHSFDGTALLAAFAVERGYYVGVGGLMTRSKSNGLREVLKRVPLELLLLETDSPYLVPSKVKSRRNEPANLVEIADSLSALLGMPQDDVVGVTTRNAERAFGPLLDNPTV
jgi:TatD DNase family protein